MSVFASKSKNRLDRCIWDDLGEIRLFAIEQTRFDVIEHTGMISECNFAPISCKNQFVHEPVLRTEQRFSWVRAPLIHKFEI